MKIIQIGTFDAQGRFAGWRIDRTNSPREPVEVIHRKATAPSGEVYEQIGVYVNGCEIMPWTDEYLKAIGQAGVTGLMPRNEALDRSMRGAFPDIAPPALEILKDSPTRIVKIGGFEGSTLSDWNINYRGSDFAVTGEALVLGPVSIDLKGGPVKVNDVEIVPWSALNRQAWEKSNG